MCWWSSASKSKRILTSPSVQSTKYTNQQTSPYKTITTAKKISKDKKNKTSKRKKKLVLDSGNRHVCDTCWFEKLAMKNYIHQVHDIKLHFSSLSKKHITITDRHHIHLSNLRTYTHTHPCTDDKLGRV